MSALHFFYHLAWYASKLIWRSTYDCLPFSDLCMTSIRPCLLTIVIIIDHINDCSELHSLGWIGSEEKASKGVRYVLFLDIQIADGGGHTLYWVGASNHIFRAIFDLSNKIALLILLRMFALKAKKKQKIKNWLKRDIFSSV